jgi:hypothetical protein
MPQISLSPAELELVLKLINEENQKAKEANYKIILKNIIDRVKRVVGE